jgi:hypothetical protein
MSLTLILAQVHLTWEYPNTSLSGQSHLLSSGSAFQVRLMFSHSATLDAMPGARLFRILLRAVQTLLAAPCPAKRCSQIGHSVVRKMHHGGPAEPSGSSEPEFGVFVWSWSYSRPGLSRSLTRGVGPLQSELAQANRWTVLDDAAAISALRRDQRLAGFASLAPRYVFPAVRAGSRTVRAVPL